jgi:hypothetical protein
VQIIIHCNNYVLVTNPHGFLLQGFHQFSSNKPPRILATGFSPVFHGLVSSSGSWNENIRMLLSFPRSLELPHSCSCSGNNKKLKGKIKNYLPRLFPFFYLPISPRPPLPLPPRIQTHLCCLCYIWYVLWRCCEFVCIDNIENRICGIKPVNLILRNWI